MSAAIFSPDPMPIYLARRKFRLSSPWVKAMVFVVCLLGLILFMQDTTAAGVADEFTDVATKFEGWISGNLGKLAALIAIGVGSVVAAVKKDWSWFFGAVVLSMGIGVIVGIVNASASRPSSKRGGGHVRKTDLSLHPAPIGRRSQIPLLGNGRCHDRPHGRVGWHWRLGFPVIGLFLGIGAASFLHGEAEGWEASGHGHPPPVLVHRVSRAERAAG